MVPRLRAPRQRPQVVGSPPACSVWDSLHSDRCELFAVARNMQVQYMGMPQVATENALVCVARAYQEVSWLQGNSALSQKMMRARVTAQVWLRTSSDFTGKCWPVDLGIYQQLQTRERLAFEAPCSPAAYYILYVGLAQAATVALMLGSTYFAAAAVQPAKQQQSQPRPRQPSP